MHKKHKKKQKSLLNNLDDKCFEQNQPSTSSLGKENHFHCGKRVYKHVLQKQCQKNSSARQPLGDLQDGLISVQLRLILKLCSARGKCHPIYNITTNV